jgi:hypothetical protein
MTSSGKQLVLLFQSISELDLLCNYPINFSAVDFTTAKNDWPFSYSYIDRYYFNHILLAHFQGGKFALLYLKYICATIQKLNHDLITFMSNLHKKPKAKKMVSTFHNCLY